MAELFSIEDSCVTLVSQNNLICAAYLGAIVFGKMKNKCFLNDKSFRFHRNNYHIIFLTFVQIAKVLTGVNALTKKKMLIDENKTYFFYYFIRLDITAFKK